MPRSVAFGLFAAVALVGCGGGGGGLFSTVPPPVEFTGSLMPGLQEVPKAGTYSGTLTKERVIFVYAPASAGTTGGWSVESAEPIGAPTAARATVGTDGSIQLKETSGTRNLFAGNLEVVTKASAYGSTVASLVGPDGVRGAYPYLLTGGTSPKLQLMPRANVRKLSNTRIRYDRYTFDLAQD